MRRELYLILHNIRSAYNVGAIFRSADGAGVSKIYLTGYTPTPHDGKSLLVSHSQKMIAKTALGAEEHVAWEKVEEVELLLESLHAQNVKIFALEKTPDAKLINDFAANFPLALILGNEVEGVSEDYFKKCDGILAIPMRGKKESLNVSVAASIAMYELLK